MFAIFSKLLLLLLINCGSFALDNGLALTPPMGWLSWERYRCITDCDKYPNECISEKLFMNVADLMVSEGYLSAGYEYVIIDDCWLEPQRDSDGRLKPDQNRFPSGIKALSDYIHSKGLKFGIYEDVGTNTCAGYPGIANNSDIDAQTFADWEVDYVKLDGCYASSDEMDIGYPKFGMSLNKTGRPIVYSCSWPAYNNGPGQKINYTALIEFCNLWRNDGDIQDSWQSVTEIIDYFTARQDVVVPAAGPGHWNDPDMLILGNYGLSFDQSQNQMAVWAILAAPLLMSNDLSIVRPEIKEILQNKRVIGINQDPLGIQGKRIMNANSIEVWTRPISPMAGSYYSYAIAFSSRRDDGAPYDVTVTLKDLNMTNPNGYLIDDIFNGGRTVLYVPDDSINVRVNPSGVIFLNAEVVAEKHHK